MLPQAALELLHHGGDMHPTLNEPNDMCPSATVGLQPCMRLIRTRQQGMGPSSLVPQIKI